MLSLPVIKGLIRSWDSRKGASNGCSPFLLDPGNPPCHDVRSYILYLATHLDIEVLVLIELAPDRKSARLLAAGRSGMICELTVPSLEVRGKISQLVSQAGPAKGRGKVFARHEVFPSEATWCDFIPMDSAVSYVFLPVDRLPLVSQSPERFSELYQDSFVLAAEEETSHEQTGLAAKTIACASLLALSKTLLENRHCRDLIARLRAFIAGEGYSLCIMAQDGRLTEQQGDLLKGLRGDVIAGIKERVASLESIDHANEARDVTPEGIEGIQVLAYPISLHDGSPGHLIFVKSSLATSRIDTRKEKLQLLGRFMSSIAHEIKNPLTGIAAGVQYLSKKLQPGVTEGDTVDFILTEINRLNRIVDDLYKIARPPQLALGETSINEIVGKILLCLSEDILRKKLSIEQDLQKDIPRFQADADRLQQILINIVKNAIEASPENGKVRIETRRCGSKAIIQVTDSGPGIPEEDRERIFEPFYSTKKGGTGLGLCISQTIIDEHGGRILVETPEEGGASFVIELPLRG